MAGMRIDITRKVGHNVTAVFIFPSFRSLKRSLSEFRGGSVMLNDT
jgi:hypothetical protein